MANSRSRPRGGFCRPYARTGGRPRTAPRRPRRGHPHRCVLRPGQDDHREVEHAGVQPLLLPGRTDQPPGRAAQRVRAVRLPRRAAPTTTRWSGCGRTSPRWPPAGTSSRSRQIVAETLHQLIDPLIYDEAATLIEEHHLAGRDVVIVSTSGAEVVEPIGEMLGADQVIATRMVVRGRPLLRRDRVLRLRRDQGRGDPRAGRATRATTSTRCYAYSDSATDLPMLVGGRSSLRRQPRPRAAQGGGDPRLAGARLQPAGPAARPVRRRLACRSRPRWPPSRSAPVRRLPASSGWRPGGAAPRAPCSRVSVVRHAALHARAGKRAVRGLPITGSGALHRT